MIPCTADPNPAVSHVMVLPLDPRAAAAVACTTPTTTDAQNVDVMELFGGGGDHLSDGKVTPTMQPFDSRGEDGLEH